MLRATVAEARVIESWLDYNAALRRAIAPLPEAQMSHRLAPGLRSAGEIAEHIVFGRAKFLHAMLGEGAGEVESFLSWDDPDDPPRTASEVVAGLELTWHILSTFLMQGSADDAIPNEEIETRQVLWGLMDHDLPHAGELSLVLGVQGLPGVEI